MKKFILAIMTISFLTVSCQKELKEQFQNPESYNPPANQLIPGMFTSMLYQWKFYIKDYGLWYWMLNGGVSITGYSQIAQRYITPRYGWFINYDDLVNGSGFSTNNDAQGLFNDFYIRMRNWGSMRDKLAGFQGKDLTDNKIFFLLATIQKDWAAARNVDLFNSIPYFDAFKGTKGEFFPEYDNPQEIYDSIMVELKHIGEILPDVYSGMSDEAKAILQEQDIAFHGDIDKWVQYTNALRLRFAIRLSGVQKDFAKQQIADILSKNNLPEDDLMWPVPQHSNVHSGGQWERGLAENAYATFIPDVIMYRMNWDSLSYQENIDDPRLPVIAMPTKYEDYRGVSYNADAQDSLYQAGDTYYPYADNIQSSLTENAKSMYNFATYTHNYFPAIMITRAEIDLLLAEIELKGLGNTGSSAGDHIKNAVIHSTNFWYKLNAMTGDEDKEAWRTDPLGKVLFPQKPSDAIISQYAMKIKNIYMNAASLEDKMEIIMQQKYIHLNIMQPYELFSELRRTRHPKLEPMTYGGKIMKPMPERLRYPSSEFSNNTDNYLKVQDQDNNTSFIFWVPQDKQSISYYMNGYISIQ